MRYGAKLKPLKLTLQGFTGISAAFGRDSLVLDLQTIPQDASLVALVGPNGAGKVQSWTISTHSELCLPAQLRSGPVASRTGRKSTVPQQ